MSSARGGGEVFQPRRGIQAVVERGKFAVTTRKSKVHRGSKLNGIMGAQPVALGKGAGAAHHAV